MTRKIDPTAQLASGAAVDEHAWVGAGAVIGPHVVIDAGCIIGRSVTISGQVKISQRTEIGDGARLEGPLRIGNECLIGSNVLIIPGPGQQATVAANCRVGHGAALRGNVTLGSGVFVKPRSLVTSTVPPHALVGGRPAACYTFLCPCAGPLVLQKVHGELSTYVCSQCGQSMDLRKEVTLLQGRTLQPDGRTGEEVPVPLKMRRWNDWMDL